MSIPSGAPAFAGTSYTTQYGYAADGSSPLVVVYPAMGGLSSERVRYSYDGAGQISEVGLYDEATYNPLGEIAQDESIGVQEVHRTYGYDQANQRLINLQNTYGTGTASANALTTTLAYDDSGNVTSSKATSDSSATETQCFSYDHLANLTQAFTPASGSCSAAPTAAGLGGPSPYWIDYQVSDATGNRLSTTSHDVSGATTTSAYSYPSASAAHPHAVSQVVTTGATTSTSAYGYDDSGNTTTRGSGSLVWNAVGKPSSVTQGTTSQSDVYDADGTLLLQTDTTAGATLFLGPTQLHIAVGSSTVRATRTYSRGSTPVAERSNVTGSTVLTWLLADQQNTVVGQIVDSSGALTVRRQDPYGQNLAGSSTWSDGHGFLNATTSDATGLVQLGARLYDAMLGRFLSADTVLAPDNPMQNNGYSYSQNDPITRSDPTGLCSAPGVMTVAACQAADGKATSPWSSILSSSKPSAPGKKAPKQPKPVVAALWWFAGTNEDQDGVIRSRALPFQLVGGYNDFYDSVFKAAGTGAQAKKYPFEYGGKRYVVWMWKGEYAQWGYGAEVGFYVQDQLAARYGVEQWDADLFDPNLPKMSESSTYNGTKVASNSPANPQVWVGSWNTNMGSYDPDHADANVKGLSAMATITFRNAGMYSAFQRTQAFRAQPDGAPGPWTFDSDTNTATIKY